MNDSTREPHERQQGVLTVTVPGRDDHLDLVSLGDEISDDLLAALCDAPAAPVADVTAWFARPAEDAMAAAVAAVALHDAAPRLRFVVSGEIHPRPFEAALAAMPSATDTAAIARGRRIATWLASRLPRPEHEAAASLLASRLRNRGLKGLKVTEVLKQVRLDAAAEAERVVAGATPASGSLPDLPAGAQDLLVPPRYHLRPEGVVREVSNEEGAREVLVTATPMLVGRRGRDIDTGEMTLTVHWRGRGGWAELEFPRKDLFDTRTVLELGKYGPFVTSNTARSVVDYLSACEEANDHLLTTESCTSGLGWVGNRPEKGFVLPGRHLNRQGGADRVRLLSPGGGFDQLLAAVRPGGSLGGWQAAISRLSDLPVVRLALLASFAAPLLGVVRSPGFGILLSCPTSRGKTTTLRIAAGVWGRPHEEADTLVHPLNCTRSWLERVAGCLGCIPLILDDTSKVTRPEEFERLLYDLDGTGRGRATKRGLDRSVSFQTVALLSGESGLGDFTEAGGARARVLQVRVPPFGAETAENAALAQETAAAMETHHGHAGPLWVESVLARDHEWESWQARLEDIRARYAAGVTGGPAFRLGRHLAVLRLTDELLTECGLLPFVDGRDVVGELLPAVLAAAADADRAAAALQVAVEHAVSNPSLYLTAEHGVRQASNVGSCGGLWGRWSSGRTDWRLAVVPGRMQEILRAAGHRYDGTLEAWKSKGWLVSDGDRQGLKKVRLGENSLRCVALARHAVEPLVGSAVDPSP